MPFTLGFIFFSPVVSLRLPKFGDIFVVFQSMAFSPVEDESSDGGDRRLVGDF